MSSGSLLILGDLLFIFVNKSRVNLRRFFVHGILVDSASLFLQVVGVVHDFAEEAGRFLVTILEVGVQVSRILAIGATLQLSSCN